MSTARPAQDSIIGGGTHKIYGFTDSDFLIIKRLVHEYTGIYLDHTKRFLVQTRLSKRLKHLGLSGFREYRLLLQAGNTVELEHLANAITTNTTSFFRHDHQFHFLENALRKLEREEDEFPNIKIWSAGCSTGEEPYTIAWVVNSVLKPENVKKVKILATDIDSESIQEAKRGIYSYEAISKISQSKVRQAFFRGSGSNDGFVKVKPEIKSLVTFNKLNLIKDWPALGTFEYIFFRNVCIYFHKDTQRSLMERMADAQDLGGYLFIGQSENLFATCNLYKMVETAIYKKMY